MLKFTKPGLKMNNQGSDLPSICYYLVRNDKFPEFGENFELTCVCVENKDAIKNKDGSFTPYLNGVEMPTVVRLTCPEYIDIPKTVGEVDGATNIFDAPFIFEHNLLRDYLINYLTVKGQSVVATDFQNVLT